MQSLVPAVQIVPGKVESPPPHFLNMVVELRRRIVQIFKRITGFEEKRGQHEEDEQRGGGFGGREVRRERRRRRAEVGRRADDVRGGATSGAHGSQCERKPAEVQWRFVDRVDFLVATQRRITRGVGTLGVPISWTG